MSAPLDGDPIALARQNWRDRGWVEAADGMAAVTSVIRVHQLLLARIDTILKPSGLSFARFEMLRLLAFAHDRRLSMAQARDLLQVHPASVTNIVDRLELDGLVAREANPDDGRSFLVALTDAGARLAEEATTALNEQLFAVIDFEPDELRTLTRLLAGFRRRSGDFREPAKRPEPL